MKFSSKEHQILLGISAVIALYDFITLHYDQFLLVTLVAITFYAFTESLFTVGFIYLIPQFIQLVTYIIRNIFLNKDAMTDISNNKMNDVSNNTTNITTKIKDLVQKSSNNDLKDISDRVELLEKNVAPKVKNISGTNEDIPSGVYPIEGEPSYPNFMESIGTGLDSNTHIYTASESSVPVVGIKDSFPKQNPYVENFDDNSINTALARTTNGKLPIASNIKSI